MRMIVNSNLDCLVKFGMHGIKIIRFICRLIEPVVIITDNTVQYAVFRDNSKTCVDGD